MDILIVLISVSFIGLVSIFVYQFYEDRRRTGPTAAKTPKKDPQADMLGSLKRKASDAQDKLKKLEYEFQATQMELTAVKEREKALLNERSQIKFDSEQYEKFKKEFETVKRELKNKEETLEKEISQRRLQADDLIRIKKEAETLKVKLVQAEDGYRRSQAIIENQGLELDAAKKTIHDQKKIVAEHSENKMGGEWVSRIEFEKVERELREKESMLQKLLALKKTNGNDA